jgi:hypothetical protein
LREAIVSDYKWLSTYHEAEKEQNLSKLHEHLMDAECAIFLRMQELSDLDQSSPDARTELQAIRDALNCLLRIKTERLKWPGVESEEMTDSSGL